MRRAKLALLAAAILLGMLAADGPARSGPRVLDDEVVLADAPTTGMPLTRSLSTGSLHLQLAFGADDGDLRLATGLLLGAAGACLASILAATRRLALGSEGEASWASAAWTLAPMALLCWHPLSTQPVSYLCQRGEVLALLASLGALRLHIAAVEAGSGRARGLCDAGALAAWLLGMLCKESAAVIPAVVVTWDLVALPRERWAPPRRLWLWGAALAGLTFGGLALGWGAEVGAPRALVTGELRPASTWYASQLVGLWRGLGLMLWPAGLSLVHDPAPTRLSEPLAWLAAVALGILLAGLIRGRHRWPRVSAAGLCGLLALLPGMGPVPLEDLFAEHRLLPGLAFAAAALVDALRGEGEAARLRRRGMILALALVVALGLRWRRQQDWSSELALWSSARRVSPRSSLVMRGLARITGDEAGREALLREALAAGPRDSRARVDLALTLIGRGRRLRAEARARLEAWREGSGSREALEASAAAFVACFEEAEAELARALRDAPENIVAYNDLGQLRLFELADPEGARAPLRELTQRAPGLAEGWWARGECEGRLGATEEARRCFEQARALGDAEVRGRAERALAELRGGGSGDLRERADER